MARAPRGSATPWRRGRRRRRGWRPARRAAPAAVARSPRPGGGLVAASARAATRGVAARARAARAAGRVGRRGGVRAPGRRAGGAGRRPLRRRGGRAGALAAAWATGADQRRVAVGGRRGVQDAGRPARRERRSRRQDGPSSAIRIASSASRASPALCGRSAGSLASSHSIQSASGPLTARAGVVDLAQQDRDRGAGLAEGGASREQRVGQAADRVEVRPRAEWAAQRLLGGHVGRGRQRQHDAGVGKTGAAEVGDLDAPVGRAMKTFSGLSGRGRRRARHARARPGRLEHAPDLGQARGARGRPQRAYSIATYGMGRPPILRAATSFGTCGRRRPGRRRDIPYGVMPFRTTAPPFG